MARKLLLTLAVVVLAVIGAGVYWFVIRDDSVEEEIRRVSERLAEYRAIERRPQDEEHARVQTSGLIAIGRKTKTGGVAPLSLS